MILCAQYILPVTSAPLQDGAILVRDGVIADIGSAEMLKMRYPGETVKNYGTAAIMPGFIDLHTHLESAAMRGIVHDVPYTTWIASLMEKSAKMEPDDWYDSAVLGGLEALSRGITTIADITSTGTVCEIAQEIGLRGVIYREVGAMDKRRVDYAMRLAEKDIMEWRDRVDADRITIGIASAPMYACHPSVFGKVSDFAVREKAPVAMHLAGNREEFNFIRRGSSPFAVHTMDDKRGFVEIPPWLPTGTTPVQYALNWGAFESENVLAIHCVHVDDKDISKLKEYDVAVAVCPRCNAQLGMGVAPINKFLRAGLRLGLGTDSPAATDSTDMLLEMRVGMLVQRAVDVGRFLDSQTMLEMATIGAARALQMDDKIGSLEVGKRADIIAVSMSEAHQKPTTDPVSVVVNACSGSDVLMNMVDGELLYENHAWHVDFDIDKSIKNVIEMRSRLRV